MGKPCFITTLPHPLLYILLSNLFDHKLINRKILLPSATSSRDCQIVSDPIQPCRETTFLSKVGEMCKHLQPSVLCQLFRLLPVLDNAINQRKNRLTISIYQTGKTGFIASLHTLNVICITVQLHCTLLTQTRTIGYSILPTKVQ